MLVDSQRQIPSAQHQNFGRLAKSCASAEALGGLVTHPRLAPWTVAQDRCLGVRRYSWTGWTFGLSQASLRTSVANMLVAVVRRTIVAKAGPHRVTRTGRQTAASTGCFQSDLMARPAIECRGNLPMISVAGFETSYNTWSSSKRAYCCANFQMGCKVMNYDCSASWQQPEQKVVASAPRFIVAWVGRDPC